MSVLDTDIELLKGVGPRRAEPLRKAGVKTFRDLLRYYPRRYLDRSTVTPIRQLQEGIGSVTVVGTVRAKGTVPGARGKSRFELRVQDESGGTLKCVWFRGANWIGKAFSVGDRVAFHGKAEKYGSTFSMAHPDFDRLDETSANLDTGRIIALYPGGAALEKVGLNSRAFRRLLYHLIKEHGLAIPEVLPAWVRAQYDLIPGNVALRAVHFPKDAAELGRARRRLKFEELFFLQLLLAQTKGRQERVAGPVLAGLGPLTRRFVEEVLPFELTGAQRRALEAIAEDTATGRQMNRMIQGDVGSGKTVVGVAAMLMAIDAGYQAAFMAPTALRLATFGLRYITPPSRPAAISFLSAATEASPALSPANPTTIICPAICSRLWAETGVAATIAPTRIAWAIGSMRERVKRGLSGLNQRRDIARPTRRKLDPRRPVHATAGARFFRAPCDKMRIVGWHCTAIVVSGAPLRVGRALRPSA